MNPALLAVLRRAWDEALGVWSVATVPQLGSAGTEKDAQRLDGKAEAVSTGGALQFCDHALITVSHGRRITSERQKNCEAESR